MFTRKMFPHADFFLNLPCRKVMIHTFAKKAKKMRVHQVNLVLERIYLEEHPKSEKNRASLAKNATVSIIIFY